MSCNNNSINNGGFVAKAEDFIVYSNFEDNNYLYKMKFDGTMKTKLSDIKCKYINIWDGWAFFKRKRLLKAK